MVPACFKPRNGHILSVVLLWVRSALVLGQAPHCLECPRTLGTGVERPRIRQSASTRYIIRGGSSGRPQLLIISSWNRMKRLQGWLAPAAWEVLASGPKPVLTAPHRGMTGPSLSRMSEDTRDRSGTAPRPSPRLHPVYHPWGQQRPPPIAHHFFLEPDDETAGVVSPCSLGIFSFGAEARTDGPRRGMTDDYPGRDLSPNERHTQRVKALPSG